MLGRNYLRLSVVPFGQQLFRSADLDPVYVALPKAIAERGQLARWLIAYWLFYSCGFACWASERSKDCFWEALVTAATNHDPTPFLGRWPRGAERRHFRGAAAFAGIAQLRKRYDKRPEGMLDFLADGKMDARSVIERAKTHHLFGDWIAFKVADLIDAVWGVPVNQEDITVFLYKTPRESILAGWRNGQLPLKAKKEDDALIEAMTWLQHQLRGCRIPHKPKQTPDWFSLETVWCKHLSHQHGHYPLLKDTHEIGEGLIPWMPYSGTAKRFATAMPKIQLFGHHV